jgi:hypothetical protein
MTSKYFFSKNRFAHWCAAGFLLSASLFSCKKNDKENDAMVPNVSYFILTESNSLIRYQADNPAVAAGSLSITGLASGENMLSIDFRPATKTLYGVSSLSKLYVIDLNSGKANPLQEAAFTPAISGNSVSLDFNPTVDRIRLVSNTGQNLRLHPELGTVVATDGAIKGIPNPMVTAVAYTNSKAGATSTVLYDIEVSTRSLYKQDPPNDGGLMLVGSLDVDFDAAPAFDISFDNSAALAVLAKGNMQTLYSIDLNTGKATRLMNLNQRVRGMAVVTASTAYATDANNNLIIFNPENPTDRTSKSSTGLMIGETVVGLDFRPANQQLYALSSTGRILTVNTANGAFTTVGTGLGNVLMGNSFGFDFNPTVDRIRLVSNTGQNLRLNPNDGTLAATDGMLNPGSPAISGAAYTNNFVGTTSTVLYVLDGASGKLFRQDPPNNGVLVEIGNLGGMFSGMNGFDIGAFSNKAFAILTSNAGSMSTAVYEINLMTGAATMRANFTGNVTAMSVAPGM